MSFLDALLPLVCIVSKGAQYWYWVLEDFTIISSVPFPFSFSFSFLFERVHIVCVYVVYFFLCIIMAASLHVEDLLQDDEENEAAVWEQVRWLLCLYTIACVFAI
jgi:hypothetical protein